MGLCTMAKLSSASQSSYWTGQVAEADQNVDRGVSVTEAAATYYATPEGHAVYRPADEHDHSVEGGGYYDGHGEKPGEWLGRGCAGMGLDGVVDAESFHALLEGRDPRTGRHLQERPKRDPRTNEIVYDPETGEPVMELPWFLKGKKRTPGFDLTFSLDKSASALWATGTPEVAAMIEAAHDEAVRAAMEYIQDNAVRVRRGEHGKTDENGKELGEQYVAEMVAAAFRHRTSRAGDPQVHTHIVAANIALGPDGDWSALDAIELFDHYRTAGAIYNAHVREGLSQAIPGLAWSEPDDKGLQHILGVDRVLTKKWSTRRQQIEQEVRDKGFDIENAEHRQVANLRTRAGKEGGATTTDLRQRWGLQAHSLDIDLDAMWANVRAGGRLQRRDQSLERCQELEDLKTFEKELRQWASLLRSNNRIGGLGDQTWTSGKLAGALVAAGAKQGDVPGLVNSLLRSEHAHTDERDLYALDLLTRAATTFTRRDVVRKIAELGSLENLEERVDAVLASAGTVQLSQGDALDRVVESNGRTYRTRQEGGIYTTPEVLAAEQRLLTTARDGRTAQVGLVTPKILDKVLADRPTLEVDQAEMIEALLTRGHQLSVVVGLAGAGKTYALEAAREGWEAAGHTVVGCSTAAVAAAGLEADAGIKSSTIASLLSDLRSGKRELVEGTVVVVDEAGMTSTRDLDMLGREVKKVGGKLVLVGDHYQLTAVEAGGMFRELVDAEPDLVSKLESNKRQANEWERSLLAQLREATPEEADDLIRQYVKRDRLRGAEDRGSVMGNMAADYWDVRQSRIDDQRTGVERDATALLLAGRRDDVDALNDAALTEAVRRGLLDAANAVSVGGKGWLVGQRVLTGENDKHRGVLNGYTATVDGMEMRATEWTVTVEVGGDPRRVTRTMARPPKKGEQIKFGKTPVTVVDVDGDQVTVEFPRETRTYTSKRQVTVGDSFEWKGKGALRGQEVTVVEVDDVAKSVVPHLQVTVDNTGDTVFLPEKYVKANVSSGYAMTVHRAQGRTVDAGLVYGVGLNREALYVAMSRGRGLAEGLDHIVSRVQNRLYVVGDTHVLEAEEDFGTRLRTDRVTAVTDARSLTATMAEDYWDAARPTKAARRKAADLVAELDQQLADLELSDRPTTEERVALTAERNAAARTLADLNEQAEMTADPVMVALRRADVERLNAWALQEGVDRGELSGEKVELGDRSWYVGQRALTARSDAKRDLDRGQALTVEGVETVPAKWSATVTLPDGRFRTVTSATERTVGRTVEVRGQQGTVTAVEVVATQERLLLRDADGVLVAGSAKWANRYLVDGYAVTLARSGDVEASDRLVNAAGIEDEVRQAISEGVDHRWYVVGKAEQLTQTPEEQSREAICNELGAQVKRSGAELSATAVARSQQDLTGDSLAGMQQERMTCAKVLDKCPRGSLQQRPIDEAALRSARAGLATASGPGGTRASLAEWTAKVAAAEAALERHVPDAEGRTAADRDRGAWLEANRGWSERYVELGEKMDTVTGLTLATLELDPPPYAPEVAGESALSKQLWRDQMRTIEQYRVRWGVTDLASPLGGRTSVRSERQRAEWDAATIRLADLEGRIEEQTRTQGHGRSQERDTGLSVA